MKKFNYTFDRGIIASEITHFSIEATTEEKADQIALDIFTSREIPKNDPEIKINDSYINKNDVYYSNDYDELYNNSGELIAPKD